VSSIIINVDIRLIEHHKPCRIKQRHKNGERILDFVHIPVHIALKTEPLCVMFHI
jgi:hypothetical protein